MKWIVILLLLGVGIWIFASKSDFSEFQSKTESFIKQEKTLKKFFDADEQNKEETRKVIEEHF